MRLKDLTLFEQVVLALSLIFLSMIVVDPLVLERASALPKGTRDFFKAITDIGKSNWMLIPTGVAIARADRPAAAPSGCVMGIGGPRARSRVANSVRSAARRRLRTAVQHTAQRGAVPRVGGGGSGHARNAVRAAPG